MFQNAKAIVVILLNKIVLYEISLFPYYKLFILSCHQKNDNTLSLHIEYKKFLHQSISYNFFTIHEQFFTSNNIELAEINDLLKKADDYIHTDYPASLIYAEKLVLLLKKLIILKKKS